MSAGFLLIHAKPEPRLVLRSLSWFLFAAGIAAYLWVADARHRENPEDRVTPTVAQMAHGHVRRRHASPRKKMKQAAAEDGLLGSASRAACCGRTRAPRRGDSSTAWCC